MSQGRFLVVEGPDGAGKTTLAHALAGRISTLGREVVEVRQPGGSALAEACRFLVLDPQHTVGPVSELFLFLAARADVVSTIVRPALEREAVVVCDRFDLSTMVYQVAGRGLPAEPVREALALASGGLQPDLTIVLDVSAEAARARLSAAGKALDRLERGGEAMEARIAEAYRGATGPGIHHLDGSGDPAAISDAAFALAQDVLTEPAPHLAG